MSTVFSLVACESYQQNWLSHSATHVTLTFLHQLLLPTRLQQVISHTHLLATDLTHTFAATRITHTLAATHLTLICSNSCSDTVAAINVANTCLYDIYIYRQLPLWATVFIRLPGTRIVSFLCYRAVSIALHRHSTKKAVLFFLVSTTWTGVLLRRHVENDTRGVHQASNAVIIG